jgi:hypothetical protein
MHPLGGECHGKKAAVERLDQIFSQFACLSLDTRELVIEGDRATAEIDIHCRHTPSGKSFKSITFNHWVLEAGWPVSLAEYYDLDAFRAFMATVTSGGQAPGNPAATRD